jgi:hypothetical protein
MLLNYKKQGDIMVLNWQDLLALGSQMSLISGFIYGLFWLERYRKQKIVEHQSNDAKKGLKELVLIEESLDKLFTGTESEQHEALTKRLPRALRELYNALLLLKELPGVGEKLYFVERLSDTIAANKMQPEIASSVINQLFTTQGGYKQECKELKEYLIRIYVLRA